MRIYFFGCWNEAGHHWWNADGSWPSRSERDEIDAIPFANWIDGGWAPLRITSARRTLAPLVHDPNCCFVREIESDADQQRLAGCEEHPQGRYLRHLRDGWTLLSWWDRAQGDSRGACNSNLVAEGDHSSEQMIELLRLHFPHVATNLQRAGVELRSAGEVA